MGFSKERSREAERSGRANKCSCFVPAAVLGLARATAGHVAAALFGGCPLLAPWLISRSPSAWRRASQERSVFGGPGTK